MNTNVIRTLSIRAKTEGVDAATASLNKLSTATAKVSSVSDTQAKRTLSVESAYKKLQSRYDQEYRAQQQLAGVQKTLDQARAQGLVTQGRASELMQAAIRYHNSGAQAATGHAAAFHAVSAQASAFAGRLGPLGGVLTSMGASGVAVAGVLGALAAAFTFASKAAIEMGNKAGDLRDFADTTGFTVAQIQALQQAGQGVGRSAEQVTQHLERFSKSFEQIKDSSGEAYNTMLQIDRGLTRQLVLAPNLVEAYDAYIKILAKADISQRNLLASQVGGKGGIGDTRLGSAVLDAGGVDKLTAAMERQGVITTQQAKEWDDLGDSITKNMNLAKTAIVSTFAGSALKELNNTSEAIKNIAFAIKDGSFTDSPFIDFLKRLGSVTIIGQLVTLIKSFKDTSSAATSVTVGVPSSPEGVEATGEILARLNAMEKLKRETISAAAASEKMISALGSAATAGQQYRNSQLQLDKAIVSTTDTTERGVLQLGKKLLAEQRGMQVEDQRIGVLGQLASIEDAVTQKRNELTRATRDGVTVTEAQKNQLIEVARLQAASTKSSATVSALGDAATEAEKYKATVDKLRVSLKDSTINQEQFNRAVTAAHPLFTPITSAFSGLAKDIAKGVDPMKALATQAEKFAESIIDVASKQIVGSLMSDLFGSLTGAATQTATQTAGATSAATILTSAGATVAASFVAGATQAAAILGYSVPAAAASLPVAGAVTGTEVATGGVVAGGALAVGGQAASLAMYGPIALLIAAIAAIAFLSDDDDEQAATALRIQRLENRQALAAIDTDTLAGKLAEFDLNAALERASLEGGGVTERSWTNALTLGLFGDAGGDATEEAIALEKTLAAERLKVIADFNEDALEAEKERVDTALKLAKASIDTLANIELSDVQQRMADITSASIDLTSALEALGLSTAEVAERAAAAVEALQKSFGTDLQSSLNEVLGKDFLNDMADAAEEFNQNLADAAAVGLDESAKIVQIYALQAQEVIDQNQLVGDSYQELINLYPELIGQIHAYTGAVTKSIAEIASELASLQTRLFNATNDSSTLEGALAEFERNAALERATTDLSNLVLLEAVLAAERLDIINDFNDAALQAQQDLLDAQQDLLDDAESYLVNFGNTIKSWLNNYLGGSSSPLSPQAALAKAQSDYQTQYNLTQTTSGQALQDALSSITNYAQTYLDAAEAYYGSSASFGTISSSVTGQLAALPESISPEQLIVNAVNSASTAIVSAQQTMQTALTSVLQTGNLATISSVLSSYMPQIDTNTDNGISMLEMQTALGTNYTTGMQAAINQVFAELDGNGNGILEKSELIKTATTNTSANTGTTVTAVNNGNDIDYNNGLILAAIQQLNATSSSQLQILNDSFSTGVATNVNLFNYAGVFTGTLSMTNTVAAALNKIVYNTYVIAENTARLVNNAGIGASPRVGTFAEGGVIPAFGVGLVSEHSPGGGRFVRAGAEPITVSPYSASNDNSAVVSELRELRSEIGWLGQRLVLAEMASAERVVESVDNVAKHTATANKVARRAA